MPSHQFVPLLYQLAARMGPSKARDSSSLLCSLMLRCSSEHPHHALPIALALTHAQEDDKRISPGAKGKAGAGANPRGQAAAMVVGQVEKTRPRMVQRYCTLHTAHCTLQRSLFSLLESVSTAVN